MHILRSYGRVAQHLLRNNLGWRNAPRSGDRARDLLILTRAGVVRTIQLARLFDAASSRRTMAAGKGRDT